MATRVLGGVELVRKFRAIPRQLDRSVLKQVVRAGAVPIQELMSALAPRGDPAEPNVSNIVVTDVRTTEPMRAAVWIGPSQDAFYAYFLEFGTKHMAAKPFVRPAFDGEWQSTQVSLGEEVWDAIMRALR